MKNKSKFALVIGIVCALILTGTLVWNMLDGSEPSDNKEEQGSVNDVPENNQEPDINESGGNDNTQEPVVDDTTENDPQVPQKPVVNQMPEDKPDTPTQPSAPELDDTTSNKKLNPNPTTAEDIKAVLEDPFMILVNRERKVSSDYVGEDLVMFADPYKLNETCAAALRQLLNAGKKAGYSYTLYSGYRSYSSQYNKYYNKINSYKSEGKSEEEAIRLTNQYYAPPGASEHHTGLAADVCIPEIVNKYACLHENYDQTEEFEWFSAHAHEYGFILRYPEGDENITGYSYEPWHYRYVGVEIATEIYRRNITLEEYVEDLESRLEKLES